MIPCYIAHPTRETSGELIRWLPGDKARFLAANGSTVGIVTIISGERVRTADTDAVCLEVTFDNENNAAYCVQAAQLRLR